jgi:hypothetical protein
MSYSLARSPLRLPGSADNRNIIDYQLITCTGSRSRQMRNSKAPSNFGSKNWLLLLRRLLVARC